MSRSPSQSELFEWLDYNSETGAFRWAKEPRPARPLFGSVAGTSRNGYVSIQVRGYQSAPAHRLAWIWCHGSIPDGLEIDHVDGNPSNNALTNLRLATSTEQKMNKRVQSNNRSGMKGAYYHACRKGKKWRSQIKVNGSLVFLGYHHTANEAHAAYLAAAEEHFGVFACQGSDRLVETLVARIQAEAA